MVVWLLVGCVGLESVPPQAGPPNDSGTGSVALGDLEVSPASLDFGAIEAGSSADADVAIANVGSAATSLTAALSGDAAFSVTVTELDVDPGAQVLLTVSFAPDAPGTYVGALTLETGDGTTLDVTLDGEATEPTEPAAPSGDIAVSETRLSFGSIDLEESGTASLEVRNDGDADLLVQDAYASDAAFTVAGTLNAPRVLAPGSSGTLEVTFTPTAEKTYNATLTIESEDPDSPSVIVSLAGEGVDLCDICSPLIYVDTGGSDPYAITDFSTLFGPDQRAVSVRNIGDQDLVVSSVEVKNDLLSSCGTFTLGGWSGKKTIAAWGSESFTITYTTTGACVDLPQQSLDMNVVHIRSNDPSESDYVIELGGIGLY